MPAVIGRTCARCETPQSDTFRFCPECGLPTRVDPILSTQIAEARHAAEGRSSDASIRDWKRLAVVSALTVMAVFVVGLGLLLFNQDLLDRVMEQPSVVDVVAEKSRHSWEPVWVKIPAGQQPTDEVDDDLKPIELEFKEPFFISKYEVPNSLWYEFLQSDDARQARTALGNSFFQQAVPRTGPGGDGWEEVPGSDIPKPMEDEMDRPVRNVTPLAIAYFCDWLTQKIGDPTNWRVRPPTRAEWEYVAREGTMRDYPWNGEFWMESAAGTGVGRKPRIANVGGKGRPARIDGVDDDETPLHGVVAMASNVQELVLWDSPQDPYRDEQGRIRRQVSMVAHMQLWLNELYRCGASFAASDQDAAEMAKVTNFDRVLEARSRFPDMGFRLVKARVFLWEAKPR